MGRSLAETASALSRSEIDVSAVRPASRAGEWRLLQAGQKHPPRLVRAGGTPTGFLGSGEVMIRKPCLVAWLVGSEWRNPRPAVTTHH